MKCRYRWILFEHFREGENSKTRNKKISRVLEEGTGYVDLPTNFRTEESRAELVRL